MPHGLTRLLNDECGQDVIEYGLLISVIGISGWLLFPGIATKIGNAFSSLGGGATNLAFPGDPPLSP